MAARELDRLTDHADVASPHAPVANETRRDELRRIRRDRETDSLGTGDDCRVHADNFATRVHKRAAGVPRIQGGVGLDDAVDQAPGLRPHRPAQRTHDAGGDCRLKA